MTRQDLAKVFLMELTGLEKDALYIYVAIVIPRILSDLQMEDTGVETLAAGVIRCNSWRNLGY